VLHRVVQKVLLYGVRLERPPPPRAAEPPAQLKALIEAVQPEHRRFDQLALHFGDRYRSGFWAIYLLSAIAVLFAILPLALGWDSPGHRLHSFAALWALGEVIIISTLAVIYLRGHRRDWQGQWLRARTTAELIGYLPVLAPLVDFHAHSEDADWYLRVFDPGQHLRGNQTVTDLCRRCEPLARSHLAGVWSDPAFAAGYARWTASILEGQVHYHRSLARRQHALQHRVHSINAWLFGLTACGALVHLIVHTLWLSLVTTFFPALGASLHGALAQSEAYRLEVASGRLANDLRQSLPAINDFAVPAGDAEALKRVVERALGLILEEHQDWQMLVMPHRLPLG
jgi:hypothetical protein